MMRAHLQEAAIVLAILTDEDRLHRGLHVVVDAAPTGAFEEGERPFVGVKHHLLGLARIDAHEHHAAVAETNMRDLHDRRHAVHDDDLVAPVELVGFARCEGQWDVGVGRRARVRLSPRAGITANGVVAAPIAERMPFLENPDQGQPLSRRRFGVRRQQPIEVLFPPPQLRARLHLALVGKRGLIRPQDLTNRIARQPQVASDFP
jgi:hypothetical protein